MNNDASYVPKPSFLGPALRLNRQGRQRGTQNWLDQQLNHPQARFMLLVDLKPVLHLDDADIPRLSWFTAEFIQNLGLALKEACFLGTDDQDHPHFALWLTHSQMTRLNLAGHERLQTQIDLRSLALQGQLDAEDLALVGLARALAFWHDSHRCCGRCGARTHSAEGGWRRDCWACKQNHFPRFDPVVIMLITHGDKALLGNEGRFPDKMYSTLAGFIEAGETIEDAVRREVDEEAGIKVGKVSYLTSQPWPFPHSLMIGCSGEALNYELDLHLSELQDAKWFSKKDLAMMINNSHPDELFLPPAISIAHKLIAQYLEIDPEL